MTEDQVEREIVVRAPIARAFAALTDPSCWPSWGPQRMEGRIAVGERPILDFGDYGRAAIYVVAFEAPRYFAYRWVQGVTDPAVVLGDPLKGPNTLVEFHLEEVPEGTRVRVVESGLAALATLPPEDVQKALDGIGKGWELMIGGLARSITTAGVPFQDRIDNELVLAAPRAAVYQALTHREPWWIGVGTVQLTVEAEEPDRRLVFRWQEPSTRVEWILDDAGDGTRVRVSESGFASLPGDATPRFRQQLQAWGVILGMLQMRFAS